MNVKVGCLYRHFKAGSIYMVSEKVFNAQTEKEDVIYFNVKAPNIKFSRSSDDWFTNVSDREDNETNQETRFELIQSVSILSRYSDEDLLKEIKARNLLVDQYTRDAIFPAYFVGKKLYHTDGELMDIAHLSVAFLDLNQALKEHQVQITKFADPSNIEVFALLTYPLKRL